MKTLMTLLTALLITAVSTSAFAANSDTLLRHAPSDSQIVIGMDLPKVRDSFVFQEVLSVLRNTSGSSPAIQFMIDSKGFDLEKDVDGVLLAFDRAPTNPNNPQTPSGIAILTGTFDQAKVEAAAAEQFGELKTKKVGKLTIKEGSNVAIAFVDKNTIVVAGTDAYGKKAWGAHANKKDSAASSKDIKQLMGLTNTKNGLWLTMVTKGISGSAGPPMDGAAISGDLTSGVGVQFHTQFAKPDDAQSALKQFEEMKNQQQPDPMVSMLGAQPLVDNLTASIEDERVLAMTTSMSDTELKMMVTRLKAMSQQPPPVAPSQSNPMSTPNPPAPEPGKGSSADFN